LRRLDLRHRSAANCSCVQVDCFHLRFDNHDVTKNTAEGIDNVAWIKISRSNLVQQWRKQSKVFIADQHHFHVSVTGDGFVQMFCCVKASEAPTSNNDSLLHTFI